MRDQDADSAHERATPRTRLDLAEKRARYADHAATTATDVHARRMLMIGLLICALVVGMGAALALPPIFAAQRAAGAFCAALVARDYSGAYALLAGDARGGLPQAEWTSAMRALDSASGPVTTCDTGGLGAYTYQPGQSTASDVLTLHRRRATTQATVSLAYAQGAWRITSVPDALYGAQLPALVVVARYCAALGQRDYATSFTLLSAYAQGMEGDANESAYVATQRLRDTLSGRITSCTVIGFSAPDSQTLSALLTITRASGPRQGGFVQAQPENSVWHITQFDAAILGVDVGPYLSGQRFCALLASGDTNGASALLTSTLQAQTTAAQLRALAGCGQPLNGTYTVAGASASYRAESGVGQTITLQFALIEGQWLVSGF